MNTFQKFLALTISLLAAVSSISAQQTFELRGKVTSFEGQPLFNISISIMNKDYKAWYITKTDSSGNFVLPHAMSGDTLLFAGIQIVSYKEVIKGNNFIMARIPTRRSEIAGAKVEAVINRSLNSSPVKRVCQWPQGFPNRDIIEAQPKINWQNFNKLIVKNLTYPESALLNQVQGVVIAGFTITAKGELQNLKIIKGIGYGCDEEVLRLLTIPTEWSPAIQNGLFMDQEFEYSVTFKLK